MEYRASYDITGKELIIGGVSPFRERRLKSFSAKSDEEARKIADELREKVLQPFSGRVKDGSLIDLVARVRNVEAL